MSNRSKPYRKILSFLVAAIMLIVFLPSVSFAEAERRVVRVAFPEQSGMSLIGHSGKLTGYNYDYLEKISEFTGWEMEYIAYPAEDGNEAVGNAIQDLMDGKVDLLGPLLKTEQTEKLFEYPQTSYGMVYTTLCALSNSGLHESDLHSTSTFTVGLGETAENRNAEVLNYLDSESISYTIRYYPTSQEQREALTNGEVDMISSLSLSPVENTHIIAKFAARPYYFAATKGNSELTKQLDAAMKQISSLQPGLQDSLFEKYFQDVENSFVFTEKQKGSLAGIRTIHVLCIDNDAPYSYQQNGEARGALVLAINDFASAVGLTAEYTFCESIDDMKERAISGEHFDFMIGLPFTSSFGAENGLIRSEPVFSAGMSLVRNKRENSYDNETVAVIRGLEESFDTTQFQKVVLFDNASECIEAVKNGQADVAAGDRSIMDYYIYEAGNTMSTATISGITHDVCIAVSRKNAMPLLGILNNYIGSLSTYTRTYYLDEGNYHSDSLTFTQLIALYPLQSLLIAGVIAALLAAAVLMVVYSTLMKSKNRELVRASNAKSDFLSRMSHDIRTPLNGIIGLLKIDEAHFDDRDIVFENHQKMMVSANHLLSLVNDVLEMSKLEEGKEELVREPTDLIGLSRDVVTIIHERATEKGIFWEFDGNPQEFYPYVYASPLHLRQIFLNIYGNSIKYTDPGGKIHSRLECLGRENNTVTYRWTISDTGIGMSEEFVKHIFDPFVQEHYDARSVYQGTGLGMSIVKNLVDRMGGSIEVSSREGVGSSFVVTLPFEISDRPANVQEDKPASIAGLHLMVAEDNMLNAEIAEVLLTDEGADITVVNDGKQAVELFSASEPGTFDAILMDVMMPVMDGLTATQTIRALERPDAKMIPIIAMTANAFAEDVQKCLAAGMNAHLAKPLEIEKMKAVIWEQLRSK